MQEGLTKEFTRATFIVRCDLLKKLKDYAYTERESLKDVINNVLEEFLQDKDDLLSHKDIQLIIREARKITNKKNICPNCGYENKKEANFCENCGEKLRDCCECWVMKKDSYSCGKKSCPGYKLITKLRE